ncbi:sensor histidine kinase [Schaalia sp. JY-X159]|uniref:sensor histidine kinase n=2 Tax=unclassified Schaalia TaxID=2691889 RepID=UPI00165D8737|nr:sensor histidine kinase [Schaalia sp. JY-X159]
MNHGKNGEHQGLHSALIRRMSGVIIAGGSLANLVMFAASQPGSVPLLVRYHPVVLALLFITPIVGGAAALLGISDTRRQATVAVLDRLWTTSVVATLVCYLWLLVFPASSSDTSTGYALVALLTSYWMCATALSSVALPMWGRLVFMAVVTLLLLTLPVRYGLVYDSSEVVTVLYTMCFNLPLLLGISWVYAQADELDDTSADFREAQLALADEEAENTALRRSNEFIHDHVLSVLTAISQHHQNSPVLQKAARDATLVIHSSESSGPRTIDDIVYSLSEKFPQVQVQVDGDTPAFHFGAAGDALVGAAIEAIRNARRHGRQDGGEPEISVQISTQGPTVILTVQDNGKGFSQAQVAEAGRFGVDQGIRARMEEVGGSASIISAPGRGTRVTLTWSGPLTPVTEQTLLEASSNRWLSGIRHSLDTPFAPVLVAVLFIAYAAIITLNIPGFTSLAPSLVALILYAVSSAGLLFRRWPQGRITTWAALLMVAIAGGANYLALLSVPGTPDAARLTWSLGLTTLIACGLLVRGRPAFAWALLGVLFATTSLWALRVSLPMQTAFALVAGQVVTLLFWNLIVGRSAATVRDLTLMDQAWVHMHADQVISAGVRRKMDEVLAQMRVVALPILEPVASGLPLTPQQSLAARLLEAELRDGIRAASFTGTPIAAAARSARERGIEVVLLDEGIATSPPSAIPQSFEKKAVQVLEASARGRVVVRLLPPGSPTVGTIHSEGVLTTVPHAVEA